MKLNRLAGSVFILGVLTGAAQARQDPSPKPSGIVVHLFGPGSVTSHILPQMEAPASASSVNGSTSQPATTAYQEPTFGGIAEQMFVTGDPNRKPGDAIAQGRTKDHP